jgi:tetratricopeptide (TPR) repeat protein
VSAAEEPHPTSPYKGLVPYTEEDARFFFGRDIEREIIISNLRGSRLTLLYGASGVGKSSVLQAGVVYHLRQLACENLKDDGFPEFAVALFSTWRDHPIRGLLAAVEDSIRRLLGPEKPLPSPPSSDFVSTLLFWTEQVNGDLLLILDQFEEYFLYHPNGTDPGGFTKEFARAVNDPALRVNFLIALREDALARLDHFKGHIPDLFDNYLRLQHLDWGAAKAAIRKPVEEYNRLLPPEEKVTIEPELIEQVLTQIVVGRVTVGETGQGVPNWLPPPGESKIETPYLQLVMSQVWEKERLEQSRKLRASTLKALGGVEGIVQTYLDSTKPRFHNLPFLPLGDLFRGREEDLCALEASLQSPGQAIAIVQPQAIHGLGGIGKTRLAVEYAWRSRHQYDATFFVVADSHDSLRANLAALAVPLNLPEQKSPVQEEIVEAVLRWLQESSRWLLILDNVDTPEAESAVVALIPRLGHGHVFITSRRSDWPPVVREQPIEKLSLEEATRFLLQRTDNKRAKKNDDPEKAAHLAKILDGLPLALEQAGAYIETRRVSLAKYLEDWEAERKKVLEWHSPVMQYPSPVAVTWQKTFLQLGPTAQAILRLAAFLAPEPIPFAMFEKGIECVEKVVQYLDEETGSKRGAQEFGDAIPELASYSMVTVRNGTFTVHRMVQEVIRGQIPEERRRDWIEEALELVNGLAVGDPGDVRTWPVWIVLRPHATEITQQADQAGIAEATARLMNQLGQYLKGRGLYAEAEPMMRRALEIDEAAYGSQHPDVAIRLNNLASLLQATNRLSEAEPMMRRALEIDQAVYGGQHPNIAIRLNNLASLLQITNRLSEAEPMMRRALEIDEAAYGSQHPDVAIRLNNLASLLQDTNRLSEAEPMIRRALEIDETAYESQHPRVAIRLNNLASLLQATNRLSEAEPLMRRALEIDEASYGSQHPDVAIDLNNLASLLQATNRLSEAEPLMRRALEIDEAAYGSQHPNIARHLNNLASLLQATNRLSEAEPMMRRALELDEAAYGSQHPRVAIRLNNLAQLLQATNRLSEAEPMMRRAVEIFEQSLGPDHPNARIVRSNLEGLLRNMVVTGTMADVLFRLK